MMETNVQGFICGSEDKNVQAEIFSESEEEERNQIGQSLLQSNHKPVNSLFMTSHYKIPLKKVKHNPNYNSSTRASKSNVPRSFQQHNYFHKLRKQNERYISNVKPLPSNTSSMMRNNDKVISNEHPVILKYNELMKNAKTKQNLSV